MDCSPPGSSVHGILQARILESVAIPFSRGSSQPRNQTIVSYWLAGRFFSTEPPFSNAREALVTSEPVLCLNSGPCQSVFSGDHRKPEHEQTPAMPLEASVCNWHKAPFTHLSLVKASHTARPSISETYTRHFSSRYWKSPGKGIAV